MLEKFLIWATMISIAVFFMIFAVGNYLDFNLERWNYEEYGKGINLLHAISMQSSLVSRVENVPMKSILEYDELERMNDKNQELECCYYYDYDYSLDIQDLRIPDNKWKIGFSKDELEYIFQERIRCTGEGKPITMFSLPAVINYGDDKNPGMMNMELFKTPVSDIAYHISVACSKEDFEKNFYVYLMDNPYQDISITNDGDEYTVCTTTEGTTGNYMMCKKLNCELTVSKKLLKETCDEDCCPVEVKRGDGGVNVYVTQ